ncbi:MAG: hypothetical protein LBS36_12220 [Oscillospiraceae bacterium]|nr:hypothetical protein [Oscillospiraceae bacterium]
MREKPSDNQKRIMISPQPARGVGGGFIEHDLPEILPGQPSSAESGGNSFEIDPRPALRANVRRRIFSAPKEDSFDPNIISAEVETGADLENEKTKPISVAAAFVKKAPITPAPDGTQGEAGPAQMVLDGFEDDGKTREIHRAETHAQETEIERSLKQSRREKARDFSIEQESLPYTRDMPQPPDSDIFQISNQNRRAAYRHLSALRKRLGLKLAVNAGIGLALLLLAVVFSASGGFSGNYMLFVFLNFILLLGSIAFSYNEISQGFAALKKRRPGLETGILFLWIAALVQNVAFFSQPSVVAGLHLFNAAAVLLTLPSFAAKYLAVHGALKQANLAAAGETIALAARIPDKNAACEMGRGVVEGEPLIQYNAKTLSLNNFIDNALKQAPSAKICGFLIPACVGVSLLAGIIVFAKEKDLYAAVTALTSMLCAVLPSSVTLSMVYSLFSKNRALEKEKSGIITYDAAAALSGSNCVILSAEELFSSENCNVHGIVPYNKMRLDDAIVYTAAMLLKSKGPLSSLFLNVIEERKDILPPVESLVYEDKLGLSAWIEDKKVLVGTLDHLRHHNVKLPANDFFSKHCVFGRKPLFLAVEGILAAMFVVSYHCDDAVARELKTLTNGGVTLLVHASDPNITEEFVEDALELKRNTVKVMNQKTSEYYKLFRDKTTATHEAENFHRGSALSLLRLMNASSDIVAEKHAAAAAAVIACLLGFVFVSVFVFSKEGLTKIGSPQLVLYHLFWGIVSLLVPRVIAFIPKK